MGGQTTRMEEYKNGAGCAPLVTARDFCGLLEIEGLLSDVDNAAMFKKEIGAD
jgi:hypothetical protein